MENRQSPQEKALRENREVIAKMLQEYEELKAIPNCNPISAISHNYFVMEFKVGEDEHANNLGI